MSNNAPDYHDNLVIDPTRTDYRYNGIYYAILKLDQAMSTGTNKIFDYIFDAKSALEHVLKNS
jgi:hypothetical protein